MNVAEFNFSVDTRNRESFFRESFFRESFFLEISSLNPLTAQNRLKSKVKSESDLFLARASPSGFAAPYHFSL